jgi:hypothetical protein
MPGPKKPEEPSTADKVMKGTKSFVKGTGKLMGMFYNKVKSEYDEGEKKNQFYKYRRHYWEQMGFPNGAPPGREKEFDFGSPAYVNYCRHHNYKIDFPPQGFP